MTRPPTRRRSLITPQGYSNQLIFTFRNTKRLPTDAPGTGLTDVHLMWPKDPASTSTTDADFSPVGTVINPFMVNAVGGTFDYVRFMDTSEVNNIVEPVWEWAYRRRPGDFFQGRLPNVTEVTKDGKNRACAIEHMVALCNEANVGGWFNLPDGSTPDFMFKHAQAVLYGTDGDLPYTGPIGSIVTPEVDYVAPDGWKVKIGNPRPVPAPGPIYPGLNPDLVAKFELGNETWNYGSFSVGLRFLALIRANPSGKPYTFDTPAPSRYMSNDINRCDHVLLQRVMVTLAVQLSDICRLVYGDAAIHDRCQPILACQSNVESGGEVLEFSNGYWNNGYGDLVANPKPPNHYFTNLARNAYRLFNISGPAGGQLDQLRGHGPRRAGPSAARVRPRSRQDGLSERDRRGVRLGAVGDRLFVSHSGRQVVRFAGHHL